MGFRCPCLPLYYLTALSIGYYSGFFLLLFGTAARQQPEPALHLSHANCYRVVPTHHLRSAWYLVIAGLLLVNFPAIRAANAPHLEQYARLAAGSLPPEGAVVLSDDAVRLTILQAELAREGKAGRYMSADTRCLASAAYHAWLNRRYPGRWPDRRVSPTASGACRAGRLPGQRAPGCPGSILRLLAPASRRATASITCKASFGSYLDPFYLQPHGLLLEEVLSLGVC